MRKPESMSDSGFRVFAVYRLRARVYGCAGSAAPTYINIPLQVSHRRYTGDVGQSVASRID
jgi:hypothetical protein